MWLSSSSINSGAVCHVGRPGHRQRCFLPIGERRRRPRLDRGARVGPTTACSGDAAATSRHLDAPPAPRRSKGRASVVGRPSKCAFVPSSSVCPAPQEARRLSPRDDDDVPVIGVCRPSLSREHRTPFPRHRRPSTWRSKAAPRRRPATAAVKVIFAAGQQARMFSRFIGAEGFSVAGATSGMGRLHRRGRPTRRGNRSWLPPGIYSGFANSGMAAYNLSQRSSLGFRLR